ncbi:MAG TPA: bifunctional riboflavin kinase/FAD synthetase, partial [Myxococcales bacterium]|nr:bifunctional riboflavin kinase/FAD synthetase [Myxococcales bacterium]
PMRIHSGIAASARRLTRGALAIGNFDGVHLGHRGLFDAAKSAAQHLGGPTCALTFEPHPARLLAPEYAPPLICTPERKRELLAAAGVDDLVVQPFDRAFAQTEPDRFVDLLLATGVAEIVVGHDFTYGRERRGTVETLRTALEQCRVRLHVVPVITVHGLVVSSTKIREFTLEGRVEAAAQLLGRPFDLDGDVVRGVGRGRKLGWPTANIRTGAELLPAVGVYAVRARLVEAQRSAAEELPGAEPVPYIAPRLGAALSGAANLGLNPTFRDDAHAGSGLYPLMLEVHLLDTDQDLYGRTLRVEFVHRLRDERRFPNVDALKEQIARDVAAARRLLGA